MRLVARSDATVARSAMTCSFGVASTSGGSPASRPRNSKAVNISRDEISPTEAARAVSSASVGLSGATCAPSWALSKWGGDGAGGGGDETPNAATSAVTCSGSNAPPHTRRSRSVTSV